MPSKHLFYKTFAMGVVAILTIAGFLLPGTNLEAQRRGTRSGHHRVSSQRGSRSPQRAQRGQQRTRRGSYQRGRYNRCYGGSCRRRNYYYSGYGPGWYGGYYDWGVPLALTGGVVLGAAAASAGQQSSSAQGPTVMPIWQSDGSLLWAQCTPGGSCYLIPNQAGQPLFGPQQRVIP